MKEVIAIIRRDKLAATKKALTEIGIDSMTIHSVEGRGRQGGSLLKEFDPELEVAKLEATSKILTAPTPSQYALTHTLTKAVQWVPKRLLEITVSDIPVEKVVQAIIKANKTKNPGDGKIFVLPMEDSLRVRTGQRGDDAIR